MNRRQVIKTSLLAGTGVALPAAGVIVTCAHQPVVDALGVFSDRFVVKEDKEGSVHIVASIDRMEQFCHSEARSKAFPYQTVRAEGNVLSFTHDGIDYRVENVLSRYFDSRAGSLS